MKRKRGKERIKRVNDEYITVTFCERLSREPRMCGARRDICGLVIVRTRVDYMIRTRERNEREPMAR